MANASKAKSRPYVVELRLALVCYGGVSLAIYMHGITKEVQKLVVASVAFERDDVNNPFDRVDSSRGYWDLLKNIRAGEAGDVGRREVTLRVVVDIISGTSAGGINGICLAKVLAGNHSQDALRDLWLGRGDIKQLLRGSRRLPISLRAIWLLRNPFKLEPPLRGDEMCEWLYEAFDTMAKTTALRGVGSLVPPDHEVELFVPITDFHGYMRDIPLYDPRVVRDRTHRHVMKFRHAEPGGGTFEPGFHDILAFTARATSSFPGAFPPISFDDYERASNGRANLEQFKRAFFPLYTMAGISPRETQFIDGGVLDNFPFGSAIDAIGSKRAATEVDRRLMYIEPDPDEPDPNEDTTGTAGGEPPGLWRTVFAGYAAIPRREPILDDLLRLVRRNEDVLRIRDVIEANFDSVSYGVTAILEGELGPLPDSPAPEGLVSMRQSVEDRALADAGFGRGTYLRLRVRSAVEGLAFAVAKALWFPPDSNECRFVTAVLRRWAAADGLFDQRPDAAREQAQRDFLARLDIAYHERRVRFLIAAMNWWYRDLGDIPPLRERLDDAKERLYERVASLRAINATLADDATLVDTVRDVFSSEEMSSARADDDAALDEFLARHRPALDTVRQQAASIVPGALLRIEEQLHEDVLEIMGKFAEEAVRGALLTRYLGFPFWDILVYPLQDTSGVDERDHVEVYRMSPRDVRLLVPTDKKKHKKWKKEKLKGMTLGHFGAFFDRPGRERDYLWGRLDAAERLVKLLLDARPEPLTIAAPLGSEGTAVGPPGLAGQCKPVFEAVLADEEKCLPEAGDLIEKLREILGAPPFPL
jgi:patatin-related protein